MKKPTYILLFILISLILVVNYKLNNPIGSGGLASPNMVQTLFTKSSPTPPSPNPKVSGASLRVKTYKFDSTTDLKKQLDSINPEVLDSDFQ